MRLVSKLTIWYLAITTLVLFIGGVIVFKSVQYENDEEETRRLRGVIADVVRALKHNLPMDSLQFYGVDIKPTGLETPEIEFQVKDTMYWHSAFQGRERLIKATESHKINGIHYIISALSFAPEPEETITGVTQSLSWTFFILLLLVGFTSILISKKILSPFNAGLTAMQTFSLKQKHPINLPPTKTAEFSALNKFLHRMTRKALDDYNALKEFTENAAHELQTPLAIIRGKLELLLESGISDRQAALIMSAHEAIEKLTRINHALTLLTQLENRVYEPVENIDLGTQLHRIIFSFNELIEMKSISLETNIEENVYVTIHPALADIMIMNLLSNAIKHNHEKGKLIIKLDKEKILISNTGPDPNVPVDQLFQRFKKSNQSSSSIGLGLSIVKRIVEVCHFAIAYTYADAWHSVQITFHPPTRRASDKT